MYEKRIFKNTVEIFGKTVFHYVPDIMKYIDEIQDIRKEKVLYNEISNYV